MIDLQIFSRPPLLLHFLHVAAKYRQRTARRDRYSARKLALNNQKLCSRHEMPKSGINLILCKRFPSHAPQYSVFSFKINASFFFFFFNPARFQSAGLFLLWHATRNKFAWKNDASLISAETWAMSSHQMMIFLRRIQRGIVVSFYACISNFRKYIYMALHLSLSSLFCLILDFQIILNIDDINCAFKSKALPRCI